MPADTGNILINMWPWLFLLALMYFIFIRPQQRRDRERREMLDALRVGDRVVSIGGIYGIIRSLGDSDLVLEVGKGTTLKFTRDAIAGPQPETREKTD